MLACVLTEIMNLLNIFTVEKKLMLILMLSTLVLLLVPISVYLIHDLVLKRTPSILEWKGLKLLIISVTYVAFVVLCITLSFHAVLVMTVPALMTAQYRYNRKLALWISFASIILVPVSIYGSYFFGVPDRNIFMGD